MLALESPFRTGVIVALLNVYIAQCPRCQLGIALNRARSDQSQIVGFVI